MKLPVPFIVLLQQVVDRLLSDNRYVPLLARLDGKVLQCRIDGLDLSVWLIFDRGKVLLERHFDAPADTVISGPPLSMMSLLSNNDALFSGDVKITGDASLGRSFKKLLTAVEIEWEEGLSHVAGDTVARKARVAHDSVRGWTGRVGERFQEDLGAWLVDEAELVESAEAVSAYCEDVDLLRERADRLAAGIALLEQRRGELHSVVEQD